MHPLDPIPAPEVAERPPVKVVTVQQWIRVNLFPNVPNGILTVLVGTVLAFVAFRALTFVFASAQWEIVRRNLTLFMVGRFPRDELWRIWGAVLILAVGLGLRSGAQIVAQRRAATEAGLPGPARIRWQDVLRRSWPLVLVIAVLLSLARTVLPVFLVLGVVGFGLVARLLGRMVPPHVARWRGTFPLLAFLIALQVLVRFDGVGWAAWQGLMLTLFLAAGGIVFSFPVGVLLALGRRSRLPVIRAVCVAYIELIRGVPLITLLFMGAFALGFFFPLGFPTPVPVTRAMIVIVAFTSAYMAEIVRGGLQAVPRGQMEAAMAVGLSAGKTQRLIVLPQALRAVIPAIVGQFISLFKDTSLVTIVALTDLLRVTTIATAQPDFAGQGLQAEALAFVSLIYWSIAYTMSRASQRLERRLGVGER